ncbi:MAG: hypothetical protein ACJA10_000963, partial [Oleispira sp.]
MNRSFKPNTVFIRINLKIDRVMIVTKARVLLGVNIDHVATLRQARGTRYPDPVQAALV